MRSIPISQGQGKDIFLIPSSLVIISTSEHSTGGPSQCNKVRKKYMLYENIGKEDLKCLFCIQYYCILRKSKRFNWETIKN